MTSIVDSPVTTLVTVPAPAAIVLICVNAAAATVISPCAASASHDASNNATSAAWSRRVMTAFANAFPLVFAGLFPILNPFGAAPIFLALTSSCTEEERNVLARRVAINSVLLLAGSMLIGSRLLVFFGITLPVVRIAGDLVLIAFGWKLLRDGVKPEDKRSSEGRRPFDGDRCFLSANDAAHGRPGVDRGCHRVEEPLVRGTPYAIAVGATWRIGYGGGRRANVYRSIFATASKRTTALLGENGVNVIIRLSAFILLCIGIQVLWTGYSTLVIAP